MNLFIGLTVLLGVSVITAHNIRVKREGECEGDIPNCETCSPPGWTCDICDAGYGNNNDDECTKCDGDNCLLCEPEGEDMPCSECEPGYRVSEGTCEKCDDDKCNNCDNAVDECKECDSTSVLNAAHKCLECPTNCKTGQCKVDSDDDDNAVCEECSDGWYLEDNTCKQCADEKCQECQADGTCNNCMPGYHPQDQDVCSECTVDDCAECEEAVETCGECNEGFRLEGNLCQECDDNCVTCPAAVDTCTACQAGYRVDDGDACEKCTVDYCAECVTDAGTCGACIETYGLVDTECEECQVPQCAKCDGDADECLACKEGFGLVDDACAACGDDCAKCDGNAAVCTACKEGSRMLEDDTCEKCDMTDCRLCEEGKDQCTECTDGNGFTPEPVCTLCDSEGCIDCQDESKCQGCDSGWALDTDTCKQCIDNCVTCEMDGGNAVCEECDDGFALDVAGTACVACTAIETGCSACTDATDEAESVCTACNFGFALVEGTCSACTDHDLALCQVCRNAPEECETCEAGYELPLDGNKTRCTRYCWTCGSDSDWGSEEQCGNEPELGDGFNDLEESTESCWARLRHADGKDEYQRTYGGGCSSDYAQESCESKDDYYMCSRCCTGSRCNSFTLDSATNIAISSLLMVAAAFVHLVVRI